MLGSSTTLLLAAVCLLIGSGPRAAQGVNICDRLSAYSQRSCVRSVTCEGSSSNLQCGQGQVIFVYHAFYGRHDRTTCAAGKPLSQVQNVLCFRMARKLAKSCNGKNRCTVKASNSEFGDPCAGTYKYLEVAYRCEIHSVTCEDTSSNLQCGPGQVIFVYHGFYGRRDRTTCAAGKPLFKVKNVRCFRIARKLGKSCNGKNSCTVKASNSEFGDPCRGTYKYLKVVYRCEFHSVICEHSSSNLQCGHGQVISVYYAFYGRRDRTTCAAGKPRSQVQTDRCLRDVRILAKRCNGRNRCTVKASNSEFGDPCVGTYKYLEVAYRCQCK